MTVTRDDFEKVWASQSPLTPYSFSESQYKEGWNFVGATPPSRQMWDFIQKMTDEKIKYIYNNMIPVGIVQAFAGDTTPEGWLLCDGSAVSRTDYADLYAVIGDTYGAGDGTSTFNLPDLTDKFVQGNATSGTTKDAGLPNITGSLGQIGMITGDRYGINLTDTVVSGSLDKEVISPSDSFVYAYVGSSVQSDVPNAISLDASRSSSVYGNADTVQPPSVTMRYIIKY